MSEGEGSGDRQRPVTGLRRSVACNLARNCSTGVDAGAGDAALAPQTRVCSRAAAATGDDLPQRLQRRGLARRRRRWRMARMRFGCADVRAPRSVTDWASG
eukprot:353465-Chlamydomonas_euryale.AAC.8